MQARPIPIFDDLPTEPDAIVERIFDTSPDQADLVRLYHQLRNVAPVHHSADGAPRATLGGHATCGRRLRGARQKDLIKDSRLVDQLGGDPTEPLRGPS